MLFFSLLFLRACLPLLIILLLINDIITTPMPKNAPPKYTRNLAKILINKFVQKNFNVLNILSKAL